MKKYLISFIYVTENGSTNCGHSTIIMKKKITSDNFTDVVDFIKKNRTDDKPLVILNIYKF